MSRKTIRPTKTADGSLEKCLSGIAGLDEITEGGLPRGRPSLVCGSAGCGKTLLGMEFIVRGATEFDEPGVFVSFEETSEELAKNVKSMGFDLDDLVARKKLAMDFVRVERSEIEETGEYDLEGLFVRVNHAIDSIKAKRVVLDTIECLFSALSNTMILRAELRRLFRWLKDKGVTAVVTGEKGEGSLTRHGIEEYVSDCVILLDHRVTEQLSIRRLRIVKYRGSTHGTNEYPFIITERGISVVPITSLGLLHQASTQRVSSGVPRLDAMLGGEGYYRGTTILVSGTAGTGKSSLAATFVDAACKRGEPCLYMAFEESQDQIIRNMRSIGIDLEPHVKKGLLVFHTSRPTLCGLEMHLVSTHLLVEQHQPAVVIVDPATNLMNAGGTAEVHAMLMRMVDYLKSKGATSLLTTLTRWGGVGRGLEQTEVDISSLIDTWILLRDIESGGERNRGMYILKSRGMAHSNQIREFRLTDQGIELLDVYLGQAGVLTGSARLSQEAREQAEESAHQQDQERQQVQAHAQRKALEAQIAALEAQLVAQDQAVQQISAEEQAREAQRQTEREAMARSRNADSRKPGGSDGNRRTADTAVAHNRRKGGRK
jgi:circadian clock protein KaiC